MLIDLKMCRFENVPWGFRLIGGADFEVPLTVVKVTEGSLAEQAGMRVGDIIVRINDDPTSNMTHNDVHHVISKCGNNFFLGVFREDEPSEIETDREQQQEVSSIKSQQRESLIESSTKSHVSEELQMTSETTATTVSCETHVQSSETHVQSSETRVQSSELYEEKVTEEVIAEVMSGEAEVLKEHNVIGVNFNRIFPKAGICQSSEVFRHLNEEATKTKTEIEKEKKKWTTFLQKPDRPIPKSKREEEEQPKSEPYRVKIVKQPKRKATPDRVPTPIPEPAPEPKSVEESTIQLETQEIQKEEELSEPPTDSEVPNLEPSTKDTDHTERKDGEQEGEGNRTEELENVDKAIDESRKNTNQEEESPAADESNIQNEVQEGLQKTEEELILEKQLADVQKQLLALSSLPSTIQTTLDAVTKQLSELLPTFKLQPQLNATTTTSSEEREVSQEQTALSDQSGEKHISDISPKEQIEEEEKVTEEIEVVSELTQLTSNITPDVSGEQDKMRPQSPTPEEIEQKRLEEEQLKMQEELQYKKQKDQKEQLRDELEQRLIRDRRPKRPSRAFGPLTPQERPLVLPGGRRWRKPKDAYNDEFIAEILSSQAELIVGTTLG